MTIGRTAAPGPSPDAARLEVLDSYRKLPLGFVPNRGQADPRVRFSAQSAGARFWFAGTEAVLALPKGGEDVVLRLRFPGANPDPRITGERRQDGAVNIVGSGGHAYSGLPAFRGVVYNDLWPGIDLAFAGERGRLKYEFRVAPGADPSRIRLAYLGAQGLALDAAGNMRISTARGVLRDQRPHTYQMVGGRREVVPSRFAVGGGAVTSFGFSLGASDPGRPLVIDPGIVYSTYVGGTGHDEPRPLGVDAAGNAYVAGRTESTDFPTSAGALDPTRDGPFDAYVTKLSADGTNAVYSTYLGGSGDEEARGIAVDRSGRAFVTGRTDSTDFPTTAGALDTTHNGLRDAFVTKLNETGAIVYSTYLGGGGQDEGFGVALDAVNQAYVTGTTTPGPSPFPTTGTAFDRTPGSQDGFVTKLKQSGSGLAYSTLLGGSGEDQARSIAVDAAGSAYVTGGAAPGATPFPTTPGAFDTSPNGGSDVYVSKLDPAGTALTYSTVLGSSAGDLGRGIAVDADQRAHVTGRTESASFPVTPNAFDATVNGGVDGFVTKFKATGSTLAYSTVLGGGGHDDGIAIALDDRARAYVSGRTESAEFPVTPGAFDTTYNGTYETSVTSLRPNGAVWYSTFVGGLGGDLGRGIAVGPGRDVFVATQTGATNFPVTPGAFDTTHNGLQDVGVTRLPLSATVELTKALQPASDPGRFDLTVGGNLVESSAGDGDGAPIEIDPGSYRIAEAGAPGTALSDYTSSIACTLNGGPGPSGSGTNLRVTVAAGDTLACTLTNTRAP